MRKRIMSLCMVLAIVLTLLPIDVAAEQQADHVETFDCSQYLTDNVIKAEDLTLDGIPFYELSIEESIAHLSMFPGIETPEIQHGESRAEVDGTEYTEGNLTYHIDKDSVFAFFGQRDNSNKLTQVSFSCVRDKYGFETGVRGLTLGDSMESALRKIGFDSNGASFISGKMNGQQGSSLKIQDWKGELKLFESDIDGTPVKYASFTIFLQNHNYFVLGFADNHLVSLQMSRTVEAIGDNTTSERSNEYLYDVLDPGTGVNLPVEELDKVTDTSSAVNAVKQLASRMTDEQKSSATGADLATLYAETAIAKAASESVEGSEVIVNAASVKELEASAAQAASAVETALADGGITTARYLADTVTLTTDETGEITIKIDPDILTTEVDKVRVETPGYALTLKTADLAEDLTEVLTITAEEVGSGFASGKVNRKVTVKVTLPKGRTTNPVTVSLPADKGAVTYQAVVKTDGSATSSKYNPATTTMDGKVNTSGTYTVQTNEKSFTDISGKSAEMQKAILYLTSKGIINGTSATTFSPNGTINRQQVAALLMRALGKVDNSAVASFKDVSTQSSLYHEIASSKKHKIVNGYSDNTFRGTNVISRAQIVTVAGRVLASEMNYKVPSNSSTYLAKYSDTVPDFAKEMVALATRENLVIYRTDGTFSGGKNMTRGDAAIILYRLFQRIW